MNRWVACAVWLAACDDHVFGPAQTEGECRGGLQNVGFAGVEELVQAECIVCHSASPLGNSLDLETDLEGVLLDGVGSTSIPYVVPGDPESSYVYQKLTGTNSDGTGIMPVGGGLSACITDVVRDWIADGATL
jgi:Planctomycete cytochrome C